MLHEFLESAHTRISVLDLNLVDRQLMHAKADATFNDCGCTYGSVFLIISVVGLIVTSSSPGYSVPNLYISSGIVIAAALFGKIVGMAIGKLRFLILYSRLRDQTLFQGDAIGDAN